MTPRGVKPISALACVNCLMFETVGELARMSFLGMTVMVTPVKAPVPELKLFEPT